VIASQHHSVSYHYLSIFHHWFSTIRSTGIAEFGWLMIELNSVIPNIGLEIVKNTSFISVGNNFLQLFLQGSLTLVQFEINSHHHEVKTGTTNPSSTATAT
jgi:hypothetical protein